MSPSVWVRALHCSNTVHTGQFKQEVVHLQVEKMHRITERTGEKDSRQAFLKELSATPAEQSARGGAGSAVIRRLPP